MCTLFSGSCFAMKGFTLLVSFISPLILWQGISTDNSIECYYCIGVCDSPLPSLSCEALNNNLSCYSSISVSDNGTVDYMKGCVIDADTDFQNVCAETNEEGGYCYTCQEDLCNEENEPVTTVSSD